VFSDEGTLSAVLGKANFWRLWADTPMNERQIKLLNKLLDGFDGKLTSSKWATIAKCSQDTALRDINVLLERDVLMRSKASGRSTSYEIRSPTVDAFGSIKQGLNQAIAHAKNQ
jgi:Fic family protein